MSDIKAESGAMVVPMRPPKIHPIGKESNYKQKPSRICILCNTMPTIYECYNDKCGKPLCVNCSMDVCRWCSKECENIAPFVVPIVP